LIDVLRNPRGTSSNKKAHPAMMLTTLAEIKSKPLVDGLRMLLRQGTVA
jgi:hypothetical protein